MKEMEKISIIGSGVVGTIMGEGFSKVGFPVVFHDIDERKVNALIEKGYRATLNLEEAVLNSDISFICVPTPLSEKRSPHGYRKMDLSFVEKAVREVAKALTKKRELHVIVIKSTVLPTTVEEVVIPILNEYKITNAEVCVNPEFLTEIARTWTNDEQFIKGFFNEDRYVIGEAHPNSKGGDILENIYKKVNEYSKKNTPIERVSWREAAWIKLVANCALASRISYFNNLFEAALKLNIDPHKTAKIVGMDKRIGPYGTIHGKAFGGKCLPKDLEAFLAFLDEKAYVPEMLDATLKVNNYMKEKYGVRE